jgi:3-hydroxyacyl-[acyl-carrier-protein] dehydratase
MRWYLVDRLIECDPGKSAIGIKSFSRSELFFMDHFPGFPIVPGVLQIEMMATTGGKAIKLAQPNWLPILGQVKNAKFIKQVQPGDQCFIHITVTRLKESYSVVDAHVEVDGKKVSQAQIFYAILPATVMDANHVDPVIQDWKSRQSLKTQNNDAGTDGSTDLA